MPEANKRLPEVELDSSGFPLIFQTVGLVRGRSSGDSCCSQVVPRSRTSSAGSADSKSTILYSDPREKSQRDRDRGNPMSPSPRVVVDTSGFPCFGDELTPKPLKLVAAAATMDAPSSEKVTVDHNSRRRKVRLATCTFASKAYTSGAIRVAFAM